MPAPRGRRRAPPGPGTRRYRRNGPGTGRSTRHPRRARASSRCPTRIRTRAGRSEAIDPQSDSPRRGIAARFGPGTTGRDRPTATRLVHPGHPGQHTTAERTARSAVLVQPAGRAGRAGGGRAGTGYPGIRPRPGGPRPRRPGRPTLVVPARYRRRAALLLLRGRRGDRPGLGDPISTAGCGSADHRSSGSISQPGTAISNSRYGSCGAA